MTRRQEKQLLLGELILFGLAMPNPSELMDPELRKLDTILDDEELLDAVVDCLRRRHPQSHRRGRKSTPADVVLRLLVLKHLRNWSYERLEWEVTGNVAYRQFCRIGCGKVPDSTTMVRYGMLLDESVLGTIFDRLLQKARERKVMRGRKMRVDTTVVESPVHYPTDSDLCADGVRVLQRELARLVAAGVQLPFRLRNVARSVQRRLAEIGRGLRLRGDKAKEAIKKPYHVLLRVTARLVRHAEAALIIGARGLEALDTKSQRAVARALAHLATFTPRVRQVVKQTRARILRGVTNSKDKLISIFEPTARILRRGKLHKPTEFGRLVVVQEADGGIVTDVRVTDAGHDSQLLVGAVERHIEVFERAPTTVATDRGFYSTKGVARIQELGVHRPVIPKPGGKSKARRELERQRWFKRGRAWRAGGEAKIARLKHVFGMSRSRYRGSDGMARAVKWAGIANNLVAIARA